MDGFPDPDFKNPDPDQARRKKPGSGSETLLVTTAV